jgi:hypothetical protein
MEPAASDFKPTKAAAECTSVNSGCRMSLMLVDQAARARLPK